MTNTNENSNAKVTTTTARSSYFQLDETTRNLFNSLGGFCEQTCSVNTSTETIVRGEWSQCTTVRHESRQVLTFTLQINNTSTETIARGEWSQCATVRHESRQVLTATLQINNGKISNRSLLSLSTICN
jgi:hypothetical protein